MIGSEFLAHVTQQGLRDFGERRLREVAAALWRPEAPTDLRLVSSFVQRQKDMQVGADASNAWAPHPRHTEVVEAVEAQAQRLQADSAKLATLARAEQPQPLRYLQVLQDMEGNYHVALRVKVVEPDGRPVLVTYFNHEGKVLPMRDRDRVADFSADEWGLMHVGNSSVASEIADTRVPVIVPALFADRPTEFRIFSVGNLFTPSLETYAKDVRIRVKETRDRTGK